MIAPLEELPLQPPQLLQLEEQQSSLPWNRARNLANSPGFSSQQEPHELVVSQELQELVVVQELHVSQESLHRWNLPFKREKKDSPPQPQSPHEGVEQVLQVSQQSWLR